MANLLSTTVNGQLNTGNVIDLGYTVNGSISTTAFRGINFHTFSDYQYLIGKRAGAWTQPLDITFYTGIRYHAHQAYGGHKFYTGGFDSNFAFSIGDGDANVRIANTLIFSSSNGTMISNGTMTDAIGYNTSYGTYIGSTVGGTYYIYGNGRFYDNGTIRTLIHSGNIGSQSVNYAASAGSASSVDGLTINNSGASINPDSVTQNQIGYNTSVDLFGQSDGGLYSSAYSSSWIHQIYGDFRTGQIAIRGKNSGTWQAWRIVLDDKNIGSYAVPYGNMTGSTGLNDNKLYLRTNGDNNHYLWNAADDWEEMVYYSGTGFRIKGSTGTVPAYFSESGVYASAYRGKDNVGGTGTASWHPDGIYAGSTQWLYGTQYRNGSTTSGQGWMYLDYNYGHSIVGLYSSYRYQGVFAMGDSYKLPADGTGVGNLYGMTWSHPNAGGVAGNLNTHGLLVLENGTFLAAISGSIRSRDDMRAPIFYDSADTTYYLDPNAGTSLKIAGGIVSTAANGAVLLKHENAEANAWIFRENAANWGLFWFNAGNQSGQTIGSYTTVGAELFGMNNAVTGYNPNSAWSGTDASTRASWMLSNYSGYLWTQGTQYSETDMRAPIFYDSQNTAYYLDPNSTSYLYHLVLSGNSYFRPNTWIQFDGNYGVYWPNHYGLHIYPNNDGSYGSLQVKGSKNSWHGIHFDSGNTLMSNATEAGFHQQGVGWKFRWYNGEMYISAGSTGGGTERTVIHSGNIGSQSVSYATDSGSVDGIDSSRIVYGDGERKSSEGYSDMNRYNQASGFYFYNNPSNNPFGDWTNWINVMGNSWASNYGFQLAHQFHGEGFMVRRVTNGTFYSWRTIIDSGNIGSQSVNYSAITGQRGFDYLLIESHSDNTKGYRIHNTSGSSVSAMFTNSSNQLVIAAGALDQINLNKKVYVNGVALGVNVTPSATAGRIDASNDIVAYSSSDERLKYNITPIENAIDKVKSLTGVEFDWKPEYKHAHGYEGHDTGIIAQQVQEVIPSAVRTNDTGFLAVRYEKLIGLLIEANKELAARVEELEKKLG
jgi:hypothetical protein